MEAIFENLARSARHPKWKGCGFLRTSVELINMPGHPAIVAGRAHKKRVEDWLCSVFAEAGIGGTDAWQLARQVILLIDGAFSVVLLHRDPGYMDTAGAAAASLVRARLATGREKDGPNGAPITAGDPDVEGDARDEDA